MVTLLSMSPTSAAVHVTCHDGSRIAHVRQGNLNGRYRLCDLDGACNGVCTFAISSVCLSCYLNTQLSPSDVCSPEAAAACKQATDTGPARGRRASAPRRSRSPRGRGPSAGR